jgi:hypothetical protein
MRIPDQQHYNQVDFIWHSVKFYAPCYILVTMRSCWCFILFSVLQRASRPPGSERRRVAGPLLAVRRLGAEPPTPCCSGGAPGGAPPGRAAGGAPGGGTHPGHQ